MERYVRFWILTLLAVILPRGGVAGEDCQFSGVVVDADQKGPLAGAVVRIIGAPVGTTTDEQGHFTMGGVPPGPQPVEVSLIGYRSRSLTCVCADGGPLSYLKFEISPAPLRLREIVVTPGRFAIMKQDPVVRQTLGEEDIRTIPQFGDDVYRAVKRLPGVGGDDISARFTVRGGEHEEVLVRLDGLELYEPFHLKDFSGGLLSIIDVMAIGGIDMMAGGFPARYGGHMSGVFDVTTLTPSSQPRTSVGISFMNARLFTEGHFADGRGNWLVSARRGYLDIVMAIAGASDVSPVYYDVLGKAEYRLNDNHLLSVHVLNAIDDLSAADDESGDHISSSYGNRYAWLRLRSTFSDQLASETVLSAGAVSQSRRAEDFERVWDAAGQYSPGWRKRFDLKETRDFDLLGLRQDWTWEATDRLMGFLGVDVKRLDSQAHYTSRERVISGLPINAGIVYDTTAVDTTPTGTTAALVGSVRWRAFEPLVVDAGLRYDHLSYTGDDVLGPRLSAVYSLGRRTFLRAAWGWFHQGQDINDLDVPFGETVYYPAQRAEHWVVGLEHAFDHAIDLRVEAYQKNLTSIRPRHENLSKDVLFAPELEEVSVFLEPESGTARGVEIFVKRDAGGRFSWWGSYALARAEEKLQGENVPKNQDQRHTIYVDCSWQPSRVWHLAMAWQYRSGWPYTERRFVRIDVPEGEWPYRDGFGPRNATLLPAYHRLDVRVNRYFELGKGRLSVFLEIINLYGRENVRDILPGDRRQVIDKELVATSTTNEEWFPLLPSIGASWEF